MEKCAKVIYMRPGIDWQDLTAPISKISYGIRKHVGNLVAYAKGKVSKLASHLSKDTSREPENS